MDVMLARLADPYSRSRVRQKIAEVGFNNFGRLEYSEAIRIAISPHGATEPGQTIAEPHTYPLAIDAVIVNGRLVIDCDTHTEARPGRLLRRYGAELR